MTSMQKLLLPDVPDRVELLARLRRLPALPESARMRTRPCTAPLRRITEWQRRADAILRQRRA